MTVRIAKSAVNIREKLAELERPIGLKGSELMRSETAQEARELVSAGRKNLIINGAMQIDQRNAGSSITPSNASYLVDRFRVDLNQASKFTSQQVSDAPNGFEKSLKITSSSSYSVGAGDYFVLIQSIEGYNVSHLNFGSSAASTVTLSFWVKSSLSGTFPASLRNNDVNRSQIKEYTVSSANTWEHKTLTFSGDTSGTWLTNNGIGLQVLWSLGGGSNFENSTDTWIAQPDFTTSGSIDLVATNGATWQITGVQLEVGKNATEFEHRSYGEELALCQRYYQRIGKVSSDGNTSRTIMLGAYNVTRAFGGLPISVAMRTRTPTITYSNLYLESLNLVSFLAITSFTRYGAMGIDGSFLGVEANVASGLSSGSPYYISFQGGQNGFLALDTEL